MSPRTMFYIFVAFVVTAHGANLQSCNKGDHAALLAFKSSITNTSSTGALTTWKVTVDCCKGWRGVKCNRSTGRVVELDLTNNELHGTIHPSLGSLSHLVKLDLYGNHLTGQIPSSLTKLPRLQVLTLSYNHGISGPLPENIGDMRSLVRIGLQSNKLTGTIPESFGKLSKLIYCELDDNMLHGPVPHSFTAHTTSLAYLELSKNKLTSLPNDLSNLKRLGILYMSSNPLTFESIAGISTLPFLGELHLSNAGLKGPIPRKWISGISLRQSDDFLTTTLDLSGNSITGGIPAELGKKTTLESLRLQNNKLSGQIPQELLKLDGLRWFNVSYNQLRGRIPQGEPFTKFDPSSYAGNAGLCGTPLPPCKT